MVTLVSMAFPIFEIITEFEVTVPIINCCRAVALVVSAFLYIFSTNLDFNGANSLSPAIIAVFAKFIGFGVELVSLCTLLVVFVSKLGTHDPFLARNQHVSLIFYSNTVSTNWL